jgi:DNA-binding NarL/FixJ family response regulator
MAITFDLFTAGKGADGYVTKPFGMKELREAIGFALAGGVPVSRSIWDQFAHPPAYSATPDPARVRRLSPKERKLIELLDAGLSYKQIADRLEIRVGTVQQHLHHIYKKLAVPSRNEAVNKYFGRMGVDPGSS